MVFVILFTLIIFLSSCKDDITTQQTEKPTAAINPKEEPLVFSINSSTCKLIQNDAFDVYHQLLVIGSASGPVGALITTEGVECVSWTNCKRHENEPTSTKWTFTSVGVKGENRGYIGAALSIFGGPPDSVATKKFSVTCPSVEFI